MLKKLNLNILHLEDKPEDRKQFKMVYNSQIHDRLVDFFSENFKARCKLELHQYNTVDSLMRALLKLANNRYMLTEVGRDVGVFILDFYVMKSEGDKDVAIDRITVKDELTGASDYFLTWLRYYFPAIPVVFLTTGGGGDVPAGPGYIAKDDLDNGDAFASTLLQYADQWWRPTFSYELEKYARETAGRSWHTPGHNAGNAFLQSVVQRDFYKSYGPMIFRTDLSVSVSRLGDLSEPEAEAESPLEDSRLRSADIFGSRDTFYVTNGTSTSNKVILQTLLREGDVALIDRNCHKSVHQAVVLAGVLPLYMPAAFNRTLGVWSPLSTGLLTSFLQAERPEQLRPKLMVITSCTYEGVLYPIGPLARVCESKEVLLLADEAWAPHLRFHPFYAGDGGRMERYNATDAGAHMSVQSTHKCLAAFSQASMIHISKQVETLLEKTGGWTWLKERFGFDGHGSYARFKHQLFEVLRYWHSTSPHYPMLATLDRAGIQMRLEGAHLIDERLEWARVFESKVKSAVGLNHVVGPHRLQKYVGYKKDPLKLVIAGSAAGSIRDLKKRLAREHITWEKSTPGCIEFLITIGTTRGNIEVLKRFLAQDDILKLHAAPVVGESSFEFDDTIDQVEVLPRAAASGKGVLKCLEEMLLQAKEPEKRMPVCAQMVTPYPPGIPIMLPGLRVTARMIENVLSALRDGEVHGVHSQNNKHYVEVMTAQDEEKAMTDAQVAQFREWCQIPAVSALLRKGDR